MSENLAGDGLVVDDADEAHGALTARTAQHVGCEHALEKLGPVEPPRARWIVRPFAVFVMGWLAYLSGERVDRPWLATARAA